MVLKISLCFLALIVNLVSSDDYSGLLSRLYKKAANEKRPLILVLDNSLKNRDYSLGAVQPREVDVDVDRNEPLSLLDLLNPKRKPVMNDRKQSLFDRPLLENHDEHRIKHSDLHRLKYRLEREQRERRERREKNRAQERDEDRYQDRDDDRYQDRKQDRYQDRNQYKKVRYDGSERNQGSRNNEKRVLRTSVIKNLLRSYNDLNCDAKDECANDCNDKFDGKKLDTCENKCDKKFDCDESEKEDPCDDDECESEEAGSTKGELLVTVTPKCKRC